MTRDTDRDGTADLFSVDEDKYEKGHVSYDVKNGHVSNIHMDPSKHKKTIDTRPYDVSKDGVVSRFEISTAMDYEKSKQLLKDLDQKYHELLKAAKEKFKPPHVGL